VLLAVRGRRVKVDSKSVTASERAHGLSERRVTRNRCSCLSASGALAMSSIVSLLRRGFDGAIIDSIAMRARETRLVTGESAFSYDLASATHPLRSDSKEQAGVADSSQRVKFSNARKRYPKEGIDQSSYGRAPGRICFSWGFRL
jgi:hypothetical protein